MDTPRTQRRSLIIPLIIRVIIVAQCGAMLAACTGGTPVPDGAPDGSIGDAVETPDVGTDIDGGVGAEELGRACTANDDCAEGASCFRLWTSAAGTTALCTVRGCRKENLGTPERNDSCPTGSACATAEHDLNGVTRVDTFCLPTCRPLPNRNSCAAINSDLTCDPLSVRQTGSTEVCSVRACAADGDCNVGVVPPDPRTCNIVNAVCRRTGQVDVAVGSACNEDADCGADQVCAEETADGQPLVGGYCTVVGCVWEEIWSCPEESVCLRLGSATAPSGCLATGCNPAADPANDDCRDEAAADVYACNLIGGDAVCWLDF